ncbi:hypothetical protein BDV96DRAFT_642702 [Lophiotrema nucula]|uniref:Glycine zipper 2TM domain-containing protein n=1 Tax=Lophiotrema nucula TaxID=690887 RepID=A0A6A5ZMK7_9PLEO|nr:hypothetical protein BDV96DRAFT_642702 [Lophiotrema nucula]
MDEYGELIELGIEGVDRVTDKYHDHIYGAVAKGASKAPRPHFGKNKNKNKNRDTNQNTPPQQQPPPQEREEREDRSFRRDSRGERDRESGERRPPNMYAPERRERDWEEDGNVDAPDRGYYSQGVGSAVARRGPPLGYEVARRAPSPPEDYGRPRDFAPYGAPSGAQRGLGDRGRPSSSRMRSYSYSPPRRERPREDRHERKRSTSPNHHRAVATIVGALAGGVIGHRVKKGEGELSTLSAVAGAVIGGIAAREGEKMYDRHKEERYEREEREERRGQRRRERDDGY